MFLKPRLHLSHLIACSTEAVEVEDFTTELKEGATGAVVAEAGAGGGGVGLDTT